GYVGEGVEISERLEVLEGYEARLRVRVTNRSSSSQQHRLHVGTRIGLGEEDRYDIQRGLCRTSEGFEDEDRGDVSDEPATYRGSVGWGGVDRKYFATLVVPERPFAACRVSLSDNGSFLENRPSSEVGALEPGETR